MTNDPEQPEQIDFDWGAPAGDGYASWQWDRQEAVRKIASLWGLPIGQRVRLRRRGIDGEFEDRLALAAMPARLDRRQSLSLRMGRMTFSSEEVEACFVVDGWEEKE